MEKRIRKKLHVGEFCEYGVEFDLKITSSVSEDEFDTLIENFVVFILLGQESKVNTVGRDIFDC